MTDAEAAACWRKLREVCGYVENASDTRVTICQDDATKTWHVTVGYDSRTSKPRRYWESSFAAAINAAFIGEGCDQEVR